MGIYGTLRQVSQQELSAIDTNPDVAYDLVLGTADARASARARELELNRELGALQHRVLAATGLQERLAAAARRGQRLEPADQDAYERFRVDTQRLLNDHFSKEVRPGAERETGLDKAWHGLHFLLTGWPHGGRKPWSLAILGGEEAPDRHDAMSYGAIRKITVPQTADVAAALATLPTEKLIRRYSAWKMRLFQIHSMGRNAEEDRSYLAEYYEQLRKFYAAAAQEKCGALFYLT